MKRITFCFFLLVLSLQLSAQSLLEIRGAVVDSVTQNLLDYTTVVLKTDQKVPVKTNLTRADGSFLFTDLVPGKYVLGIIAMGYQTKNIDFELSKKLDLGKIYISPQSTALNAVVVTADRPLVKMDIDKMTYDLQADPESKVNSVLEMMRKVPLLSLDHEENIQLKGSSSYRIMINGKPSAMLEKSPKDILRSMPASSIQSIEVITNPPAKYDGEGLTGIINIVTVKKIDNGYNGNVNLNHRFPRGGPGSGASLNFKQGKWGVSANFFGNLFHDPQNIYFNTRHVTGFSPSDMRQDGQGESRMRNAGGSAQLSYEIDSLNLLSIQLGSNTGSFDGLRNLTSLLTNPGSILEAYDMSSNLSGKWHGADASLNYQLGFKSNKQQLLTLSYRFTEFYDERDAKVAIQNRVNYILPDFYQFNEGGPQEQTIQLDYVQPIKKITMETGFKGIFRDNYSGFRYSSKGQSGAYIINPALSNLFDNTQNVYSFYNSWQATVKDWGFKAGIRLEETRINANFISSGTITKQDYLNLLPSVSVSRKLKDKSSLGFAYSQRIQRPNIWDLNPFVDRSNPNLERTGNPTLRPVIANNFQITYSLAGKTSFSAVLSHTYSNNALQYFLLFDPVTNINRLMPDNTGSNKTTGININIGQPINSRWNVNLTSNINYVNVKGYIEDVLAENDGITGNFMASSSYRFENGWRINGNANYLLSPYVNVQGAGIAILFCGFSVNKDLFKERLSLSAQFSNPFTKYVYFPNNIKTDTYEFVNSNRGWFRAFSYGLNYKFGKLKSAVAKNKRGINNDDVEAGGRP